MRKQHDTHRQFLLNSSVGDRNCKKNRQHCCAAVGCFQAGRQALTFFEVGVVRAPHLPYLLTRQLGSVACSGLQVVHIHTTRQHDNVCVTNSVPHTSRVCGLWACKVFTAADRQDSQEHILVSRPHPRVCSCSLLSSCHCCCIGILQQGGSLEGGLLQVISTAAQRSTAQHERCQDRSQVRPCVLPAQDAVITSCPSTACRRYLDHHASTASDHIMADQDNAVAPYIN